MALPKKEPAPKAPLEQVRDIIDSQKPTMQNFEKGLQEKTTEQDAETPFEFTAIGTAFKTTCEAITSNNIPEYELRNLFEILPASLDGQVFDADFSMAEEVTMQLTVLKAVRDKVISHEGKLVSGQTVKDAKDLIQSSASLLQLLQKLRNEIINSDRLKAVEDAVITTLKGKDEEVLLEFMDNLRENLERIK